MDYRPDLQYMEELFRIYINKARQLPAALAHRFVFEVVKKGNRFDCIVGWLMIISLFYLFVQYFFTAVRPSHFSFMFFFRNKKVNLPRKQQDIKFIRTLAVLIVLRHTF